MNKIVVFATYYQQKEKAATLIEAMKAQIVPNWELIICSNGDPSVNELDVSDPRIKIKLTPENTGHWGALNRKKFIEEELGDDDLLINTSVEDYYAPVLTGDINQLSQGYDFIHWDFSHHTFRYLTTHAMTQPRVSKIDWGSYAVKGKFAKNTKMSDKDWTEYVADGLFVEHMVTQNPDMKIIRLPKILMIKN
jgi:hypothetical protein